MNFLERLVAEWYELRGYFVKTNVRFGPRANGGYIGEVDVLAAKPRTRELVHIEVFGDAPRSEDYPDRIRKKFERAEPFYSGMVEMEFELPQRIAIVTIGTPKIPIDGVATMNVDALMREIKAVVYTYNGAIPERYGYLRAIQFAQRFGKEPQSL